MCAADGRETCGQRPAFTGQYGRDGYYRARDAAGNPLHRLVIDSLLEFKAFLEGPRGLKLLPHPSVLKGLEKYVECGLLRYGAVRFRCEKCGHDIFVAFSCKRRGLCPSCDAKRSAIVTAAAVDRLLPKAGYRQWVFVIPKRLRYFVSTRANLSGWLSKVVSREIARYIRRKTGGEPAQLHFIQRFGASLNLHVHIHAVVSDGAFSVNSNAIGRKTLGFIPAPKPDEKEAAKMVASLRRKVLKRLCNEGCITPEAAEDMLHWEHAGFFLHNEVGIAAEDRAGLERLVKYCSRPGLSTARLIYAAKTKTVIYRAEAKDAPGALITMTPVEFMRRWCLLVPPPHKNLIHYYGALAPRSPLRGLLTAQAERESKVFAKEKREADPDNKRARSWAACLARVFEIFPVICPKCKLEMRPVAVIFDDKELERLLKHFHLPTAFPQFKPAAQQLLFAAKRAPPDEDSQVDPRVDKYEGIDPPAPED